MEFKEKINAGGAVGARWLGKSACTVARCGRAGMFPLKG
jgi:hypothetical protein